MLLGALLLAFDRAASRALPLPSVDVLLVVGLVVLTGALHLDGLADAADALFGGREPAQRLEIMRDVHAGTYAIVAVAGVLALKWAGLAALPSGVRFEALLLTPCIARAGMLVTIAALPYARPTGLGVEFKAAALPWRAPVFLYCRAGKKLPPRGLRFPSWAWWRRRPRAQWGPSACPATSPSCAR